MAARVMLLRESTAIAALDLLDMERGLLPPFWDGLALGCPLFSLGSLMMWLVKCPAQVWVVNQETVVRDLMVRGPGENLART